MTAALSDYPPLRDFTAQQWRDIIAKLPKGATPTYEARLDLVIAANVYWEIRSEPPLREQMRPVAAAVDHLQQAKDDIRVAAPQFELHNQLVRLEALLTELTSYWDFLRSTRYPSVATVAKSHREEFLSAALELWLACGGKLKFSRSSQRPAGGPLIRYLIVVSDIVLGEAAAAPDSLAAFIQERRRR